jgi:hypothetical protein
MAWKKSSEGWRVIHNPVTAGAAVVLDRQSALDRHQYPYQVAVRPDDLRRPHGAPKRHQFGAERSVPFPHGKTPYPAMYLGWIGGAGNMVNFAEGVEGPLWGGGAAPPGLCTGLGGDRVHGEWLDGLPAHRYCGGQMQPPTRPCLFRHYSVLHCLPVLVVSDEPFEPRGTYVLFQYIAPLY